HRVAAHAARGMHLVDVVREEPGRAGRGAEEPGRAVAEVGARQPGVGDGLLRRAKRVYPVGRESAQQLAIERVRGGPAPAPAVRRRKFESLQRAGDAHRDIRVAEELHPLEAVPQFAEAMGDRGAIVADAGDETETGDNGRGRHPGSRPAQARRFAAALLRMKRRRSSSVRTWMISSLAMLISSRSSVKKTTSVIASESKPRSSTSRWSP